VSLPKRCFIVHGVFFETWGPKTPDERGIGQSETANIELAERLARRGWEVTCFAPIPDDSPREYKGVHWRTMDEIDWSQPGYWLIFRQPELMDRFPAEHPDQWVGIVSQDEAYPGRWNDVRCAKLDALFALCLAHQRSLEADLPALRGKVKVAANGIKLEMIRNADSVIYRTNADVDAGVVVPEFDGHPTKIVRDPHRIMWASSPDRGLLKLLKIFKRLREWVPDASLYVAYGFDNIDKLVAMGPQFGWMQRAKDEIMRAADQPGVHFLGRIPQPKLMLEWAKTGLLVYPTLFRETYCSSHCEAQAMGAIPVCSPVWALGEHALGGSLIPGDPADPLIASRFVGEMYSWMVDTRRAERTREILMREARTHFHWGRAVDLYESHLLGYYEPDRIAHSQFNFQIKQCLGSRSILNLGCADDPAKLKQLGAINLDARQEDPIFRQKTAADVFMDMRDLSGFGEFRFDTLVYGDCLEHFKPEEVPYVLREGLRHLTPDGKVVITVPEDYRAPDLQHTGSDGSQEYQDGISAVHLYPVTQSMLYGWLEQAGLEPVEYQEADCYWYMNHGVSAVRKGAV
jgi:glycosyltransferase involved in cell wall biosynthesis